MNVDYNGAHRLIFEKLEHEGRVFFVLRSIAFHHDYRKALGFTPIRPENLANHDLYEQVEATELAVNESAEDIYVDYQGDWLKLDDIQQQVCAAILFPLFVYGPPGSGKTALPIALFNKRLRHYFEVEYEAQTRPSLRMLYVTNSSPLVRSINREWLQGASSRTMPIGARVSVDFKSI